MHQKRSSQTQHCTGQVGKGQNNHCIKSISVLIETAEEEWGQMYDKL